MKNIYFLGECMVELKERDDGAMSQSFAGDVYNSAVYLKRCFPEVNSAFITVIGKDKLSNNMFNSFKEEGIDTSFVFRHNTKAVGIYFIETDEHGERSFTYWRNDSAARKIVEFIDHQIVTEISKGDMLFISGISLAILDNHKRQAFWEKIDKLKSKGMKLVFDPNYRARLWQNEEEAKEQFTMAFNYADIALPGLEDLSELFGIRSMQALIEYCQQFSLEEVIIKNGPESVVTYADGRVEEHSIKAVTNVIDTTSAGDAFNGAYLGARLSNFEINQAVQLAAKAAGTVIQFHGAIVPTGAFLKSMQADAEINQI